ncbi:BLUF domain-containing protein [Erythrobacter alti]|uniref:BLUF domain-containing protein n=1 Tax=Erythrobacter alti TaxID=1896145 RepID=UPI0030F4A118
MAYISTAAKLDDEDIKDILVTAVRNNQAQGITGFLLYNGRNFLQLVEGESAALMSLFARLSVDPRHSGMVITSDLSVSGRCYPDWQMKLLGWHSDVDTRREEIGAAIGTDLNEEVRRFIMNFAALN